MVPVIGLVVVLATATPACAHNTAGATDQASNYDYRIDSFHPGVDGISLSFIEASNQLQLENTGDTEVIVLGYQDEPYLRVGPDGVFENVRSPATYLNAVVAGGATAPEIADATAAPEWKKTSDGTSARWHDHRSHWMAPTPEVAVRQPDQSHEIAQWQIPFDIGGDRVYATGTTLWVPGPDARPWIGLAVVLGGAVCAATLLRRWRIAIAIAAVVLIAGATLDTIGAWWASPSAAASKLAGLATPSMALMFVLAGMLYLPRRSRDALALLAGGSLTIFILFGWMSRSYLGSSQIPTHLPGAMSRTTVAVALGVGAALVIAPLLRWRPGSPRPATRSGRGR